MTVIQSIVGSAGSMIKQQLRDEAVFLLGVRGQFEWIERELSRINLFLQDADRMARGGNNSIKGRVLEVMGVAHDADDAIAFFVWMEERRKRRTFIDKCLFFCCDLLNLHKAGVMIEAVKRNIEEISRSRSNFLLKETSEGEGHEASSSSLSRLQQYLNAITDFEEELFVGFEDEMAALLDNLMRGDTRLCVVSIVAMGGAGKTTLARKLYNNSDVKAHFGSMVAWVCVSQTYSIKELLQGIAEQVMRLKREDSANLSESRLRQELRKTLQQRKYLIVVDDIWNQEAWDLLQGAFPDGNEGSRILLTTRNMDVASYADRLSSHHQLRLLDEDESWDLFLNIVFPPQENIGKPICPPRLEDIARQMVAKCGGLPLAIKALGRLSFTRSNDANVWRKKLDHLKWQLSHEPKHFDDILALSYLDLPDDLKPCFLYLGIFPEDYEIPVEILTRLWIAEGFIPADKNNGMELEDVAEEYIMELAKRSMIQVIWKSDHFDYFRRCCRVHDVLRDLAINEARRVGLFKIVDKPMLSEDASASISSLTHVRRLGVHLSGSKDCNLLWPDESSILPKVRSFLWLIDKEFWPSRLGCGKWLRVLHLADNVYELNMDIAFRELAHLKYLRIGFLISLTQSIDKLYNLQTLDLGWNYVQLPAAIWSLCRLRLLIAHSAIFEGRPQLELLQHLHTLALPSGKWIGEQSLIKLSKLRNLWISESDGNRLFLEEFGEALIKTIQQMDHLQRLRLYGRESVLPPFKPFNGNSQLEEIILCKVNQIYHELPPMLSRLVLDTTYLKGDPMSTMGKLENLRLLTFRDNAFRARVSAFRGSKLTVPKQGFPRLERFELAYLYDLEEWTVEEGAMPALKHLKLGFCSKLKMLPEGLRDITTLKELIVEMPSKFCRRLEKSGGEDWHKIQHIQSVTILPY